MVPNIASRYMETELQIELLRRQYLQLLDPDQLSLPANAVLKMPEVQAQIYANVFSEMSPPYAPPKRYQFRVLKRLLGRLEQAFQNPEEDEISGDLTSSFAQLLAQPAAFESESAQEKSFVTYSLPLALERPLALEVIVEEARTVLASSGNTGLRTWEAALSLGTYLCSEEGELMVRGKTILELGAGSGFISILCVKHLKPRAVLTTDGNEKVVEQLRSNIDLNGLKSNESIAATVLRWGEPLVDRRLTLGADFRHYDLILGADIIYDSFSAPALASTLHDLFTRYRGTKFLLSAAVRNEATFKNFLNECALHNFRISYLDSFSNRDHMQTGFFHLTTIPVVGLLITEKLEEVTTHES